MKPIANLLIGCLLLFAGATGNEELEHLNRIETALGAKFGSDNEGLPEESLQFISQSLDRLINPPPPPRILQAEPSLRWPQEASDEVALGQLLQYGHRAALIDLLDQLASFHDEGCEEWRLQPLDRLLRAKNKLAR